LEAAPELKKSMTEKPEQYRGGLQLYLDVCKEVAKNTAMGFQKVRAWRLNRPRAFTAFTYQDEELERYAFLALRSLLGITGSVKNLNIVELGPGDFMTSGLSLLAAGAASYTVIDRFVGDYSKPEAKEWYKEVEKAWPRIFPEMPWPDYLNAENFPEGYTDRIQVLPIPIEEVTAERLYDVVCSYQVGEHVSDINSFAEMNARLLVSGGVAVHRVDFGPHDCWFYYRDPLTFLRFPDWLWSLMGSNRGTPNRHRFHEFCAAFENAGLKVEVISRDLFPEGKVEYQRLAKKFRRMPQDSLATGTAIFVCRK
jgi:hypothetical protein